MASKRGRPNPVASKLAADERILAEIAGSNRAEEILFFVVTNQRLLICKALWRGRSRNTGDILMEYPLSDVTGVQTVKRYPLGFPVQFTRVYLALGEPLVFSTAGTSRPKARYMAETLERALETHRAAHPSEVTVRAEILRTDTSKPVPLDNTGEGSGTGTTSVP
jgi:hypothetical protein